MIKSVEKASGILSLFSYAQPRWGISEIVHALGIPKGTAHNLVKTLSNTGFLKRDAETRRYSLGPKLFTLGSIMAGTLEINQRAAGPAHKLSTQTGFVCRVAIWDKDAALITLNMAPRYAEAMSTQIGPRVAAYCSAIGRVFLAHMDNRELEFYLKSVQMEAFTSRTIISKSGLKRELKDTRDRGFAVNDQELAQGRASLALPILGKGGELVAAISLTGSPDQILCMEKNSLLSKLRAAAAEVSRYMGFYGAQP